MSRDVYEMLSCVHLCPSFSNVVIPTPHRHHPLESNDPTQKRQVEEETKGIQRHINKGSQTLQLFQHQTHKPTILLSAPRRYLIGTCTQPIHFRLPQIETTIFLLVALETTNPFDNTLSIQRDELPPYFWFGSRACSVGRGCFCSSFVSTA
jgi:hypothetical protein